MAKEATGAEQGGALEFKNPRDLELWLEFKPRNVGEVIAARAALRVAPLVALETTVMGATSDRLILLSKVMFRADALAWVAAAYPTFPIEAGDRNDAVNATIAAIDGIRTPGSHAVDAAGAAVSPFVQHNAVTAETAIKASPPVGAQVSNAIAAMWRAITWDAAFIAHNGEMPAQLSNRACELALTAPLWPRAPIPELMQESWTRLSKALPREDDWQVWLDWYERRLKGTVESEEIELIYASVPQSKWDEGAASANRWIRDALSDIERHISAPFRISSEAQLQEWLQGKPREIAVAIVVRAVLRVLPATVLEIEQPSPQAQIRLANLMAATFRALSIARLGTMRSLVPIAASAERAAFVSGTTPAHSTAGYLIVHAAGAAVQAALLNNNIAAMASAAVESVIDARLFAVTAEDQWRALSDDVVFIESQSLFIESQSVSTQQLMRRARALTQSGPLWLYDAPPDRIQQNWINLGKALPHEDDWQVWIDWYERRLKGVADSEEAELIYVEVPQSEWDQGAAAANRWISKRLEELRSRLSETIQIGDFVEADIKRYPAPPVENVPSAFTYGVNAAGQIDIAAGAQNIPFIAHPGDEATHRLYLDAARKQAERLALDLGAQKFNANLQYRECLERYVEDIPSAPGEGNIILADAEARALRSLFAAETSALNEAFAARLREFLKTHFALLAFYEDEMQRFHAAARKGSLDAPFPREAVQKVGAVISAYTPTEFAPRVSEGLKEVERPAPVVELEPEDLRAHAPIQPPDYPYDDADYEKTRRLGVGGSINALYGAVIDRAKDPEKAVAMITIAKEIYEHGKPLFDYLRKTTGL